MKPYTITIPFTVTFDPAAAELAELARHIVTRLTDEGALDEAAEHGHGIMATSAAIEWARERLGNPIPAVLEPAPNAGDSALYGAGETLEQLARTGELDRAAGLEHVLELPSGDTVRFAATDEAADLLAVATEGRRMIRTPQAVARPDGLVVDAGQGVRVSTPLARVAAAHGVTIHPTDVAPLLRDRVYAMALAIDSDVFAEAPALRMTRFLASAEHLALIDPPTIGQPDYTERREAVAGHPVTVGSTVAPHRAAITPEGDVYAGLTYPKEQ